MKILFEVREREGYVHAIETWAEVEHEEAR